MVPSVNGLKVLMLSSLHGTFRGSLGEFCNFCQQSALTKASELFFIYITTCKIKNFSFNLRIASEQIKNQRILVNSPLEQLKVTCAHGSNDLNTYTHHL